MLRISDSEERKDTPDECSSELCSFGSSPKDEECSIATSAAAEVAKRESKLHAWLTVMGSSLVYFATFGIVNSFGFFQAYYEKNLLEGVPASTISFIGTIQLTLMNLLAAPAGSLFDCYGLKVSCTALDWTANLTDVGPIHRLRHQLCRRAHMPFLRPTRIPMANLRHSSRLPRHSHLLRNAAGTSRGWPTLRTSTRTRLGDRGSFGKRGRRVLPCHSHAPCSCTFD